MSVVSVVSLPANVRLINQGRVHFVGDDDHNIPLPEQSAFLITFGCPTPTANWPSWPLGFWAASSGTSRGCGRECAFQAHPT
jgi:hypothetical protein